MRRFICLVLLGALFGSTRLALAVPSYTFIPIDVPGNTSFPFTTTMPSGINAAGQIVGSLLTVVVEVEKHGFLLNGGSFTRIDGTSRVSPMLPIYARISCKS